MSELVRRLLDLAEVARSEGTGTSIGDALHFEEAAKRIEQLEWELSQERNSSNRLVESLYAFNKNSSAILSWYYMRNKVKVSK